MLVLVPVRVLVLVVVLALVLMRVASVSAGISTRFGLAYRTKKHAARVQALVLVLVLGLV